MSRSTEVYFRQFPVWMRMKIAWWVLIDKSIEFEPTLSPGAQKALEILESVEALAATHRKGDE